ncbi:MAG TPA: PEP-CTERM sorting domain-containing protein [Phycisphaerae bacterium]|nr:PEP-CTERM sorting domain-containing protein [Phycisphaerae bacterium]
MSRYSVALMIVLSACATVRAADVSVTWDGSTANWQDSSHWGLTPPLYPDNAADTTYAASIGAGTVTLDDIAPTIDDLDLTGGILTGTGSLTINHTFNWSGASVGVASVLAKGTVNLTLSSNPNLPSYTPSLIGTAFTLASGAAFNLSLSGTTQTFNFQNSASFTNNGTFNVLAHSLFSGYPYGLNAHRPDGDIINNGTMNIEAGVSVSSTVNFENAGTINLLGGQYIDSGTTMMPSSTFNLGENTSFYAIKRNYTTGNINNAGTMVINYNGPDTSAFGGAGLHLSNSGKMQLGGYVTIGDAPAGDPTVAVSSAVATPVSTFVNTGSVEVQGTVYLYAAQDAATNGSFLVDGGGNLEFGADYSFASSTDPTLTGSGTLIVDPGVTLTVPEDVGFTGTIEVNGTLVIAAPRDPTAHPVSPSFTVVGESVPEPGSLGLLGAGAAVLLGRRRGAGRRRG